MNKVKKELNNIINNKYKTNNLSCGFINFILREEIFKGKEIEPNNSKLTYENVKNLLDNNYKVSILHDYKNHYKQFKSILKISRYGNHLFTMLKIENKYYIVQGYINEYKLKIVKINNLEKFIKEILQYLTGNDIFTKKSNDIYKKNFKTDLKAYELNNSLIGKKMYDLEFTILSIYK